MLQRLYTLLGVGYHVNQHVTASPSEVDAVSRISPALNRLFALWVSSGICPLGADA